MIKVVKFGGSSVANAEQFKKVKSIVNAESARKFVCTSSIERTWKAILSAVFSPTPGKYLKASIKLFILLGYIIKIIQASY